MTPFPVLLVEWLVLTYIAIFLHELGHAVMGSLAGFEITSFGMGTSRVFCVIPVGGMRIYFSLARPFQGVTWTFNPQLYPSKGRMIAFAAGGILANGLAALLCLGLAFWQTSGTELLLMAAVINGVLSLANLVPYRARIGTATAYTDGMLIVRALRSLTTATPAPTTIQTTRFFRRLMTAIGDTRRLRLNHLAAAGSWAELSDAENADAALAEADAVIGPTSPALDGFERLIRAEVDLAARRLDAASESLDAAEAFYRSEAHEVGLFLVAIVGCRASLLRGDAGGMSATLNVLETDPLTKRHPPLGLALISLRLLDAITRDDPVAVRDAVARFEARRHAGPSATRVIAVHVAAARYYAGRGELEDAEPSFRRAIAAVAEIAGAWPRGVDRARFLERQAPLLDEARGCLEALGKGEEAVALLLPLEGKAPTVSDVRDRRLARAGLWLMGVNLAIVAGSVVAAASSDSLQGRGFLVLASVMGVFSIAGGLYLGFHLALWRRLGLPRLGRGRMVLLLACVPWLIAISAFTTWLVTSGPSRR